MPHHHFGSKIQVRNLVGLAINGVVRDALGFASITYTFTILDSKLDIDKSFYF